MNGKAIPLDKDGYLKRLNDWNREVGEAIARAEDIELTDAHWEVLEALQSYYQEYDHAPAMRPFVKYTSKVLGKDKGNSIYLMQLFPQSPARIAARIAGLPRPKNCL